MTISSWKPVLGQAEVASVAEVILGANPGDGDVTEAFASRIAELCGVSYGVGVSSGSAALYCALAACGVGPGDEVIVPDMTFVASANAVRLTGASVALVDIDREHFGLDPARVEAALTAKTKAIVLVDFNGRGGAVEPLLELARHRGVAVVEDAAQALGSRAGGRPLGSYGDVACFSFAPSKIITTGQGGVVVTDDAELATRVRRLKDQGRAARGTGGDDEHPVFGFNFKLSNIQAAVGMAQLASLNDRLAAVRRLYGWYQEELGGLEPWVRLSEVDLEGGEVLAWIVAVVDGRDDLFDHLQARGIQSRKVYRPLHSLPPYARDDAEFPVASWLSAHGLWLPSGLSPTRDDVAAVGEAVREFVSSRAGSEQQADSAVSSD